MALELFKPYIIERIEKFEGISTTKQAKRLMEEKKPEVLEDPRRSNKGLSYSFKQSSYSSSAEYASIYTCAY